MMLHHLSVNAIALVNDTFFHVRIWQAIMHIPTPIVCTQYFPGAHHLSKHVLQAQFVAHIFVLLLSNLAMAVRYLLGFTTNPHTFTQCSSYAKQGKSKSHYKVYLCGAT